ncbi:MAG: hypothetical protein ABEH38_10235 [Flavobacteriales bacterium]
MKNYDFHKTPFDSIDGIRSDLENLEARTRCLIELSLDERCALPKLDEDRERFTQKALEIGRQRPELLPEYVDLERLETGLELRRRLMQLFQISNKVTERIDDTIIASGSEAYVTALNVLQAMDAKLKEDPSLQEPYDQLQRLFEPWEHIVR